MPNLNNIPCPVKRALAGVPSGMLFKTEVDLILYLVPVTGLHRTTLKRNTAYYQQILGHLGKQMGAAGILSTQDADRFTLHAQLLASQLCNSSQAKEIARLKKAIAHFIGGPGNSALPTSLALPKNHATQDVSGTTDFSQDTAFGITAMALALVLTWVTDRDLGLVINPAKNQIEDHTAFGSGRIVVGAARAKYFFRFLADNEQLFNQVIKR